MRNESLGVAAAFGAFHFAILKPGLPVFENGLTILTLILIDGHNENL